MNKAIFVLDIDYKKEIKKLTYPVIRDYASKIRADLIVIDSIKFPAWPMEVEKFQIYNYKDKYDWYMYIDLDALIHPDCPDFTEFIFEDYVFGAKVGFGGSTYKPNIYFKRDGRFLELGNWFSICSNFTIDLWNTEEILYSNAVEISELITPKLPEKKFGMSRFHLVDGYLVSNNIAKFGLNVETIFQFKNRLHIPQEEAFLWHVFLQSEKQKLEQIRFITDSWRA